MGGSIGSKNKNIKKNKKVRPRKMGLLG